MIDFQNLILKLNTFWSEQGCAILCPYDAPMGAGTFHPSTIFGALTHQPCRIAHPQPCRRPQDGRYGENPNRLQRFHQYQVLLKPSPSHAQKLVLQSFQFLGMDIDAHDVRFVEDDWQSPTLGATGRGWEVWCDGMEILQFTYFQQIGGMPCDPISVELAYGLERLALVLNGADNIFNVFFAHNANVTYGDLYLENEKTYGVYHFQEADVEDMGRQLTSALRLGHVLVEKKMFFPAYDACLQGNHALNVILARGAISPVQRADYIQQLRSLACMCLQQWVQEQPALRG